MSYYLLPKINSFIYKNITCIEAEEENQINPVISNSLSSYLYEIKEKIDLQKRDWDIFKKYTNTYEYIDSQIPHKKKSVSKYRPLSRSYFKMIEMVYIFNLRFDSKPIHTFHLAEGPGGFIEAIVNLRNSPHDIYTGMTILDNENNPNIPAWKKTEGFLKKHPNVIIEKGADSTGNILSLENFVYCKEKYGNQMNLITADGGFDFSIDFNKQEITITKLLFAQICFALAMQKQGGCFILKIFDCFMQHTIDLLYILSSFYERVYILKPNTSRSANSEKYIICKGFLYSSSAAYYQYLYNAFDKMLQYDDSKIYRFLSMPIPYYFLSKLEEYNAIIGQQQLENIHYTISLIENKYKQDKIDNLTKVNIQKCIHWCMKHNIECQSIMQTNNIFLNH